ncbi:MAG: sodium/solute symporter [Elusimicrobia bacterium]|nr:sodium/solute symporter [Elusimicrobiota bacterium]
MDETAALQKFSALGFADYAWVALAVAVLLAISYFKGKDEADTQDFFLGRRKIPVWAATLSFVATEISAMTIVGVPAAGFKENWQYLQFFIGSAAARILIALLFIPAFYKYNCTTIYEFLKHRFGPGTQYAGSFFFFITRLFASGLRLYAASLAVSVILGWPLVHALVFFTVISIAFIGFGGIKAVVWTGTLEAMSFYFAGGTVLVYLFTHINGGFSELFRTADVAGKLSLFNLGWGLKDPNVLWIAVLNGIFGSMAAFGTDQELMQRLLTLETRRDSQKTIIATIFATIPLLALYLSVGTLLFVFYSQNPSLPLPDNPDKILSHFTVQVLPAGLKGIVLMAVVMASIDSPLSSLSSSFITDIYRPLLKKDGTEKHYLLASRFSVAAFGIALAFIAYSCRNAQGMLWLAYKVNGVTAGSLLGVFLLGLLTRARSNRGNVAAMFISAGAAGLALYLSETGRLAVGWSWMIVIGTALTFALGWLLGLVLDKENIPPP